MANFWLSLLISQINGNTRPHSSEIIIMRQADVFVTELEWHRLHFMTYPYCPRENMDRLSKCVCNYANCEGFFWQGLKKSL